MFGTEGSGLPFFVIMTRWVFRFLRNDKLYG